jgi:Leucine-rich repeat (LRR) protein
MSPQKSSFQYSLFTLLIILTVAAIVLGIGSNIWRSKKRKEASAAELTKLGYRVEAAKHLSDHFDDKFLYREISCQNLPASDKNMTVASDLIDNLDEPVGLDLTSLPLTDEDLAHIKNIPDLFSLVVIETNITDDGLKHIGEMQELRILLINHNIISDKGLIHLYALQNLEQIYLDHTQVTENGVRQLVAHLPNLKLITLPGHCSKEFMLEIARHGINVATIATSN